VHALPGKLAHASAAGYAGIELFHEDIVYHASSLFQKDDITSVTAPERIAACEDIAALCLRLGLHIVCLQPFRNYEGLLDRDARAEKLSDLRTWITMAHVLGTDLIAIASSLLPASETTGDPAHLADDLAAVADLGAAANPPIRFSYEALCFGTQVRSWQQEWDLVKRANRPNLGLCLDTFNLAGWDYADPAMPGGVRPDGPERLRTSLSQLAREVPLDKIFYVQVVDAEQLRAPLVNSHTLYVPDQPSRMTWSRACRLFYGESARGAYMPIRDVMDTVLRGLAWRGWVSMELFNRSLEELSDSVPEEHARRGMDSWRRLVQDFPELKDAVRDGDVRAAVVENVWRPAFVGKVGEPMPVTLGSRL
jgi:4-hydroxyphenylpyruvate dioxygenase